MRTRLSHGRIGESVVCLLLLALLTIPAPRAARAQSTGDAAAEIVYIDPAGVVRVRDPLPATGSGIAWFSPVGGYVNAVLLDVNGDADMEIAAVRAVSGVYSLDIYDPVVTTGPIVPGQSVGGVPWALLTSIPLAAPVGVIGVGNLDSATPGDEILLSARVPASGTGSSTRYKQSFSYLRNAGDQDGKYWQAIGLPISSEDWTSVALGDMTGDGIDEIGLVASRPGTLTTWQMRGPSDVVRVFKNETDSRPWLNLAMGPFRGGNDMLGAVRDAPIGLPSLLIFRWQNNTLVDEYGRAFDPSPDFIFFADINGSGDAEAYMIRFVDPADPSIPPKPRLIMRQRGTDPAALTEAILDPDNGFRVGAGGDIDGDGKDEVVLIRKERIREYLAPEWTTDYVDTQVQSNGTTLVIGDLDGAGYLPEVTLLPSPAQIALSAPSGTPSTVATLTISGNPAAPAVPISANIANQPFWLAAAASSTTTPAQITLTLNAATLPPGTYGASLLISSSSPLVLAQPLVVPISVVVGPGLMVLPTGAAFVFDGCPGAGTKTLPLRVDAPSDTSYRVSLLSVGADATDTAAPDVQWPSSVPWLSASSATGIPPETLQLTANAANVPEQASAASARAIVMATVGGNSLTRTVPVTYLCATSRILLPIVAR